MAKSSTDKAVGNLISNHLVNAHVLLKTESRQRVNFDFLA